MPILFISPVKAKKERILIPVALPLLFLLHMLLAAPAPEKLLTTGGPPAGPVPARLYVSELLTTGNNDGSSWENAFRGKSGLSEALNYARENEGITAIWVAKGTYIPSRRADTYSNSNANDRNNAFRLVEGIKMYGGFAGTETDPDERDWSVNQTILSGEIGNTSSYFDNCYHVVVSVGNTAATELNGFILTMGMAGKVLPGNTDPDLLTIGGEAVPIHYGGGMYSANSAPVLRNVVFTYNYSRKNGAGMANDHSFPDLANVVFFRNLADEFGGAIYNINSSLPQLAHTTLHKNYAGAIVNDSNSGIAMVNSVMWGNTSWESSTPTDIFDRDASGTTVKNSVTQAYGTEGVDGIIKQDPKFMRLDPAGNADGRWMTEADGLILLPGSPAIDAGDDRLTPADVTRDIAGVGRRQGMHADMGAYEFTDPCGSVAATLYVDSSNAAGGDGSTWNTAFPTLREAIEAANKCSVVKEIRVAEGTYFPTELTSRDLPFAVNRADLKIRGGYPAGGGIPDHRAHITILDGNIGDPAVSTDNAGHIMTIAGLSGTDSVVVDGFTFQNGRTVNSGASININNVAVPRIHGGALYIGKNAAETPIVIRNCTFTRNYSEEDGGAVYCAESTVTLYSCRFFDNEAVGQAPAIYVYKGSMPVLNSLFTQNVSGGQGGAITFNEATSSSIVNSTFYKNRSKGESGGAINCLQSELAVKSSIFNTNRYGIGATDPGREKSDIDHHGNSTLTVEKSLLQSGSPYISCEDCPAPGTDPQFIDVSDATKRGLGLLAGSRAINRGDRSKLPDYIVNDLLGADRTRGAETDIGAFEAVPLTDPLTRLYVKESLESGYNNGYDWENAFYGSNGFGRALEYARNNPSVKEIWVAGGTYYTYCRPDNFDSSNPLDPDNSFLLVDGLKIYGGFAGDEEELSQRDWKTNVTTLSGDQNRDNLPTDGADAYQVIVSLGNGPETMIDGFTVTGGHAAPFWSTELQVNGTTIYRNSGGGMYNLASSPTIRNCTFYKNVSRGFGGGMANWENASPTMDHLVFRQNKAKTGGGLCAGLRDFYGEPVEYKATHIVFENNVAEGDSDSEGGAAFISRTFISFENAVFSGNTAPNGGAICVDNATNRKTSHYETYRNCIFFRNTAVKTGGVYRYANGNPYGPRFINSTFSENSCQDASGGDILYVLYYSMLTRYPAFYNCVMKKAENAGAFYGGNIEGSNMYLVERNLTDYPMSPYFAGMNVVTEDFGLSDSSSPAGPDGAYGTADDGLIPLPGSPAVNAGSNERVPAGMESDFNNNRRIQGPFVDIGAYETYEACDPASAAIARDADLATGLLPSDDPVFLLESDRCRVMGMLQALNPELQEGNQITARTTVQEETPAYNGRPYVRRHYDLVPGLDAETHEGYLTLYFSNSDFQSYNNARGDYLALPVSATDPAVSNLRIWQWHGTSSSYTPGSYEKDGAPSPGSYINPDDSDIKWNEGLKRWEVKFRFSGFSGFFITTPDPDALPVTLADFRVTAGTEPGQKRSVLQWSTVSEVNSRSFVIERSGNGKSWEAIGKVTAEGSSTSEKRYTFEDRAPLRGNNLYRLRMIDRDASFSFSSIRSIYFAPGTFVYPNPVSDRLYIETEDRQALRKVRIYNAGGQLAAEHEYTGSAIPVPGLSPGLYQVELLFSGDRTERMKIVVTR